MEKASTHSVTNWNDYKYIAATFKRTVSKAKDEYNIRHFDFLSQTRNRGALFRFMTSMKMIQPSINEDLLVLTRNEMTEFLKQIGKGLESRFSSCLPCRPLLLGSVDNFEEVSLPELASVVVNWPAAAPGPDGVTSAMIKILYKEYPDVLLALVNHSIEKAWIPLRSISTKQ